MSAQLEARIQGFAKPLHERIVMPTFIISHVEKEAELDGLNLGLQFNRDEPEDTAHRITIVVVSKDQTEMYLSHVLMN